jgi:imidazole glycerol phosphate synthase subunit HisF
VKSLIARDNTELAQQYADLGFVELVHQQIAQERRTRDVDLLAVAQAADRGQEHTNVVGGVEYLRHAALDVEQCVDSLHRRSYGVLGGEDAVALLGFRELPNDSNSEHINPR